jgi:quercetin dioxygenase-like cupin family protein
MDIAHWDDPFKVEQAYEGIERRVLAFDDEQMVVHYTVAEGAEFPAHEHETTKQSVYVVKGAVELFGDHEATLEAGDSFVVGPGVRHGVRGVAEETELVDTFTPPIDAYAER